MKKEYQRIISLIAVILLLGLAANQLWLTEITRRIGWYGMLWLSKAHYSVFFIILLVVIAYLLPFYLIEKKKRKDLILPGMFLYTLSLIAFHAAKILLFTIYSKVFGTHGYKLVISLMLIAPVTAFGYYYITDRFILRIKRRQVLLLTLAIFTTVPLSRWTVQLLPSLNFGTGETFVDAVKMGFPFFWVVTMMGVCALLTCFYYQKENIPEGSPDRSDILDDQLF